jgi:hypothetical protein
VSLFGFGLSQGIFSAKAIKTIEQPAMQVNKVIVVAMIAVIATIWSAL